LRDDRSDTASNELLAILAAIAEINDEFRSKLSSGSAAEPLPGTDATITNSRDFSDGFASEEFSMDFLDRTATEEFNRDFSDRAAEEFNRDFSDRAGAEEFNRDFSDRAAEEFNRDFSDRAGAEAFNSDFSDRAPADELSRDLSGIENKSTAISTSPDELSLEISADSGIEVFTRIG
jgi:hypothetical protein